MTKILDCTIRDGGYLNNWEFSDEEVGSLIGCAIKNGVEYFEIGYRSNKSGSKFLRCENSEISQFLQAGIKLLVMLNVSDFEDNLFEENSFIKTVRVACHSWELAKAIEICEKLLDKNYEIFLHLMNVKDLSEEDFLALNAWERKSEIISLYFADSYGSFFNEDVEFFYKKLKKCGFENVSFHAHNNLQMAFSNSLKAIEIGAYSIDATLAGKGRGGGNLPVEMILAYLNREKLKEIFENYSAVLDENSLKGFKNIIGGIENIHPKEIENFLAR